MMAIGNNAEATRAHNRRVVLEIVRLEGAASRAEIGRRTGLTTQAVSNITAELVAEGLLIEAGRRRAGRGQPPLELRLNPDGGHTIGVELGPEALRLVAVDLAGRILAQRETRLRDATPDLALPTLAREVAALRQAPGVDARRILGAGVVMPGPFPIEGLSGYGPTVLPGWGAVLLPPDLEAALGCPALVENDATAAAMGERLHGAARALRHFCFIHFGTGLGLGLVLDGRPYKGANGNAGEIGHIVVEPRGRACPCGNRGCLERYVSLHALEEELGRAGLGTTGPAGLQRLWAGGAAELGAWLDTAAAYLRPVILLLENLFDPEAVILGGALPEPLLDELIRRLPPLLPSIAGRPDRGTARLLRGTTGRFTAALGAAALPVFATLSPAAGTARLSRPAPSRRTSRGQ